MRRRPVLLSLVAFSLVGGGLTLPALAAPKGPPKPKAPVAGALVADAGDSAFVSPGQLVTLVGSGFGGTGGYVFDWSFPAQPDAVRVDGQPTAALDTTGVAPGTHSAVLTVTDTAGATATDSVLVAVAGEQSTEQPLLEESRTDAEPGAFALASTAEFPFEVPAGLSQLAVDISWTNPANDYDLRLVDPDGNDAASSGGAPPATSEATGIAFPAAGTWTVVADRYLTAGDTLTATATGTSAGTAADPRPLVDAGGPYRFVDGATQTLTGTVTGGTGAVSAGWDLDNDGDVDAAGATVTPSLPAGRHLVTLRAVDAAGYERQRMTSVLVGTAEQVREQTVPLTVIGIADSGINPYHQEFSAAVYPDPEVLELTRGFTRHPSEYIDGYPADAAALPISTGKGYLPASDEFLFEGNAVLSPGRMYWVPGTKIIGAYDAGGSTGATSGADSHPILDDNGHGTGSSSVSAGNRYGYCPTCLIVNVEALDESVVAGLDWVDLSSNSFGYVGGAPIGLAVGPSEPTRLAAERGQTTLFAAGNGVGNTFDVPIATYGSDQTGPDWNITVGALRRDDQGAIVGDGIPADVSSWGDGNLPSACKQTVIAQCAFGGTSAATPYTAGVFGTVLTELRDRVGDGETGQRPGQVVVAGTPIAGSAYLDDGALTREELRAAVLKTASPLNPDGSKDPRFPNPLSYTAEPARYVFEGYGAATPSSGERAVAVLTGEQALPARPDEDAFLFEVCQQRYELYGAFDRDGVEGPDACDTGYTVAEQFQGDGEPTTASPRAADYRPARSGIAQPAATEGFTYFLHRTDHVGTGVPGETVPTEEGACGAHGQFMTRADTAHDSEPCYSEVATGFVASYRPMGIWASTDVLDAPLPAGSEVTADVFLAATPQPVQVRGVLMATDRELGLGETTGPQPALPSELNTGAVVCEAAGEACWAKYTVTFTTERPAVAGEQLTFQVQQTSSRAYAYGYEAAHVSTLAVTPAALPDSGLEFGATVQAPQDGVLRGTVAFPDLGEDPQAAGFHPTVETVQVSVDDATFARPLYAAVDPATGTWTLDVAALGKGRHTVFVRALRDRTPSPVVQTAVRGR